MILRSPCVLAGSAGPTLSAAIVGAVVAAGGCTLAAAATVEGAAPVADSTSPAGVAEAPPSPSAPVSASGAVLTVADVLATATGGSTTVVMSTGRSGVANARRSMIGGASS